MRTPVPTIGIWAAVVILTFYLLLTVPIGIYNGGPVGGWTTTFASIAIQLIGIPLIVMVLVKLWRLFQRGPRTS